MNAKDYIHRELDAGLAVRQRLRDEGTPGIAAAARVLIECLQEGGKVLWCGNGGSAADCQHLSTELVARFSGRQRPGIASLALTTDSSLLTAYTNDHGFEGIFRRQVEALARPGDALVAISTSGQSPNIIAAAREAVSRRVKVIALIGAAETPLTRLADAAVAIPTTDTQRIQELHITVGHILCGLVEDGLFPLE